MQDFRHAIINAGLTPPERVMPGEMIRFPGYQKPKNNKAAWCKLFLDCRGGVFGDFSTGLYHEWQQKRDKPYTKQEQEEFKRQVEHERKQRELEQKEIHDKAKGLSIKILKEASIDYKKHPYYIAKHRLNFGIHVKSGQWEQRGWSNALLIPMYNENGEISSIQAINEDGKKDYLKGGSKKGCYYPIGNLRGINTIMIGEGLSTVAAAHETTGLTGIVAFDSSNLINVAKFFRKLDKSLDIIILADNDVSDSGLNTGVKYATEAAQAVNGSISIPVLESSLKCDFWDLFNNYGRDTTKHQIIGYH